MNFESLQELNDIFRSGQFGDLPKNISVEGIQYNQSTSIVYPIPDLVYKGWKDFLVYAVDPSAVESQQYKQKVAEGKLNEWVIFIWSMSPSLAIVPTRVATNTAARARPDMQTATNALAESEQRVIGDFVEIFFNYFNKTAKGKVDTGANMSSLHAEEWKILPNSRKVEFYSSLLSNNKIITEVIDQVVVKTSEGTEYRPVISLDVTIEGQKIPKAQFNLNDRSHMQDRILVGQNILERGNFLVDPSKVKDAAIRTENEQMGEYLQSLYKDVVAEDVKLSSADPKHIEVLYKSMLENDISFGDLVRYIKGEAYKAIEETMGN